MKEGELLFRFGDLEGWELTAEPLGVISFGQACQVWRKNDLVAKQPSKAADVPFSFQLWDEEPDAGEDNWRADEDEDDVEWIADLDNELLADLADDLDENGTACLRPSSPGCTVMLQLAPAYLLMHPSHV